jgi:hypothetical protein
MAEMADIMQEMAAKMQRVKEIKTEMDKLKQVQTKTKATKVTSTTGNNKITCECGCKINKSSWYTHIKTKKHVKLLSQTPKAEVKQEQIKEVHDDDDENDDHDDEKTIDDNQVDKVLNQIKERFYKGLYVRHYEHQNFLDISIRMSIHKHYDTYKDYKLIDREINNILNEHLETYPNKINKYTKSKEEILDQILKAKLWNGVPVNYCISDKDMKEYIKYHREKADQIEKDDMLRGLIGDFDEPSLQKYFGKRDLNKVGILKMRDLFMKNAIYSYENVMMRIYRR